MKHHSEDYKQTAVLHYLDKTNNYTHTCEEFNCDRISLMRWVKQYEEICSIKRQHRKPISHIRLHRNSCLLFVFIRKNVHFKTSRCKKLEKNIY